MHLTRGPIIKHLYKSIALMATFLPEQTAGNLPFHLIRQDGKTGTHIPLARYIHIFIYVFIGVVVEADQLEKQFPAGGGREYCASAPPHCYCEK